MQRDRQQYTSHSRPTNTNLTNLKQDGTNDAFPFVPQQSRIVPNNPSQSQFFNLNHPMANHNDGRRSISPTCIERSTHLTEKHDNEYRNANHHQQINMPRYMDPPHTPNSLKIPTTPTRSKSLSPSLRNVIQPPRMRHKQQVLDSVYTLNTTSQQTDKERQQQQNNKHATITSSSSCFSFSNNENLHRFSTHGTNQYDKPYSDVNTQFEWKHTYNRKPIKLSVNKSTKIDDSLKASHTSNKSTQVDKELDSPTKNQNIDDCSINTVRFVSWHVNGYFFCVRLFICSFFFVAVHEELAIQYAFGEFEKFLSQPELEFQACVFAHNETHEKCFTIVE
jgi:hypothetical protein